MNVETEFDLLGLFQGVGLPFQSTSVPEPLPNMVWLYRRPILDYWAEHEDSLGAIVTHVLVHEIGHHFGLSDDGHRSDRGERRLKGATTMKIDGRCHCGYLSFEAEADPQNVSICHCTDCQTGSGSAFRISIRAPGKTFKMLSGEPTLYPQDHGRQRQSSGAGVLPELRHADLFHLARRQSGRLHGSRRHLRQRDQLTPEPAELVPLGAALGHRTRLDPAQREGPPEQAELGSPPPRSAQRMSPIENMHLIGRRVRWDNCGFANPKRPPA